MKMTLKRLFSLMLVMCLLLSNLPVGAFAEELAVETEPTIQAEQSAQQEKADQLADGQVSQTQNEGISPASDEPVVDEGVSEVTEIAKAISDVAVVESTEISDIASGAQVTTEADGESSYLEQMNGYYEQAVAAGADADSAVYTEIYNGAMAVYVAAGSPSAEENPDLYNAMGQVVTTLQGYGYDPSAVETTADVILAQGGSATYRTQVNNVTRFTVTPSTTNLTVTRISNNSVRVEADEDCDPGTYTVSYGWGSSFTVEVTASTSGGGSGSDTEDNGPIKVYVYVSSKNSSGDSWLNNEEFQELIGLTVCDSNGYFPAGEIYLDSDFLDGKNADVSGEGLITSNQDWTDLLAALGAMDTSILVDGYNNVAPSYYANFSENRGNTVYQYLSQAEGYTGTIYGWGSMHTALFRWHKQISNNSQLSLGFDDQSVKYHLDLCFNTNKITFITGNNGIDSGVAKDGTKVDERVYITGSEIQQPRNLQIPAGYEFMGYYEDADFTIPWNGIGTPLNNDETVYIKITEVANVVVNYVVAEGIGTVNPENEAFNPITESPAGSIATPGADYVFEGWYSDASCTTKVSNQAAFVPDAPDGGWNAEKTYTFYAKFVPATVDLTINKVYVGLPEGLEPDVTVSVRDSAGNVVGTVTLSESAPSATVSGLTIGQSYTVVEDAASAAVENYKLNTVYSCADGLITIASGTNAVTVTNTYTHDYISVTVTKVWDDADNQDGIRPESVTVELYANGVATGKILTISGESWTGTFTELDQYANGAEIVYTVQETNLPAGYEATVDGLVITNTHETEKITVSGAKTWNDNNNQDGARPASITIHLLANGEEVASKTVTAEDNWAWAFEGLEKYAGGQEIRYTVSEDSVPGYTASVNGTNVTNTHEIEKTSISGAKTWDDADNQDGIRPSSIKINLLADGEKVDSKVVTAADGWTWTFGNLDKYKAGQVIAYTITEEPVDGYTTTVNGTNVTNTHVPSMITISGSKTWDDAENQDGIRPATITVVLKADGEPVHTRTVSAENGWAWTFANLPEYAAGQKIQYTISELTVDGYSSKIEGFNVTNTHVPAVTSINVTKTWDDANNQDGKRPNSVTIELFADGVKTDNTLTLSEGNNWTGSFENLPVNKAGTAIVYTIAEQKVPEYQTTIAMGDNGYTVTNRHVPEVVTVSGAKTWDDNNNQDGARPASITINLLKGGEKIDSKVVTEDDGWAWSFTNLPKYENGTMIEYSISEEAVHDYSTSYDGNNVTNTHTPAQTSVTVSKSWDDNNDQDGIRPNDITVVLEANGTATDKTLVLNDGNNWTGSFTGLDKFENGKVITYTVKEIAVEDYATVIAGDQNSGYTITNTHTPETVEVSGAKTWEDNFNQDGKRPGAITINLMKDGQVLVSKEVTAADDWKWTFTNLPKYENHGTQIVYSITEAEVDDYTTTYNGYNVTNTHAPEKTSVSVVKSWRDSNDQDGIRPNDITVKLLANGADTGKTLVLNEGNSWTGSFTELDKFADGQEIVYTIEEIEVAGYESVITGDQAAGFIITNTHNPETVEVAGSKTWDDNNNQDGFRPDSITINLLKNGQKIDEKVVTAADGWTWSFPNLPKYENHGTLITYSVTENAVDDYTSVINGYNVTNTHAPEKTSVTVTKAWQDNNDQDGIRPNDITVKLLGNGVETGKTLVLNQGNSWTGSFADLDKYADGEVITYTVAEVAVTGYNSVITGNQDNGYIITNSHTPAVVAVSGSKTWDDNNNQDGKRPASITINLLKNGTVLDTKVVTEADGWAWSFPNLPKYENHGILINYSIEETVVDQYTTVYDGYDVTNTHAPEKTSVTVTKAWQDNNDQDGIRPNDITVKLLGNGEDTGKTLVLNDTNNWTGSFTDLDKYANGAVIAYTVQEIKVEGYNSVVTGTQAEGYTITNSHTPAVVEVAGAKTWDDKDNQDGMRPESITIKLLADGVEIDTKTVTEADGWAWSFTNLPEFKNHGTKIIYTISEVAVDEYSATIDGFNVTNKHTPEETSVTVTKSWQDNDNQDGIRPEKITVNLLADGKKVDSQKITAEDNWTYTFTKLDVYAKGVKIVYTVEEEAVEGYETVITGDQKEGFIITNSHTPAVVEVAGAKTWDDANDQDGKRPDAITVNLLANGKVIETVEVTAEAGWAWSFTNLPKFEAGVEIIYTITEDAVEDYTTTYDGYNITNKYTPQKTSITVTKRWVDGQNHDGIRPNSVKVVLYANGKKVDSMRLSEKHKWTGVFEDLPVYQNGERIKYTLQEKSVSGYNATITGNARKGFIVTNTHNIIPKTGDESNLPLYTGLFAGSMSVMAVLMYLAKPKKGKYAR